MTLAQVHVRKDALTNAATATIDSGELADGAIRLKVESFSVTANNITYAVVGDGFGYWNFFPAPDGWGRVPVWGFADVAELRHISHEIGHDRECGRARRFGQGWLWRRGSLGCKLVRAPCARTAHAIRRRDTAHRRRSGR